jgi:hypothetical protein
VVGAARSACLGHTPLGLLWVIRVDFGKDDEGVGAVGADPNLPRCGKGVAGDEGVALGGAAETATGREVDRNPHGRVTIKDGVDAVPAVEPVCAPTTLERIVAVVSEDCEPASASKKAVNKSAH